MNFSIKRSSPFSLPIPEKDDTSLSIKTVSLPSKASHMVLGVCSATVAFPLVTLAIFFSIFFSEEKWEEFWDKLLEA